MLHYDDRMTESEVIKRLIASGQRITEIRREIIRILCSADKPMSAAQILASLEGKVNRTTVYREIWFLKDQGLIAEVSFGEGKTRFELKSDHCHHHLVCDECGEVEDVVLNENSILTQVKKLSKFQTQRHSIEFFGLCHNCQSI